MENKDEKLTVGGGCFWCLDPLFSEMKGVKSVVAGYSGGEIPNPPYQLVCTGMTGHAEVIQITFDPQVISREEILRVFLTIHDPTTLNRQGADTGTQYRSVIFYQDDDQKQSAQRILAEVEAAHIWPNRIVTELAPFKVFYPAEDYHQQYFAKNPSAGYCRAVIAPKVAKFRKTYLEKLIVG